MMIEKMRHTPANAIAARNVYLTPSSVKPNKVIEDVVFFVFVVVLVDEGDETAVTILDDVTLQLIWDVVNLLVALDVKGGTCGMIFVDVIDTNVLYGVL